jgi:hypothetical protein
MASGTGGQIAAMAVTSLYHAANSSEMAANARWTNFVSEDITHTIEPLMEGAITGNRHRPYTHEGLTAGGGNIQFEPNPNAIGMFLRAAFGQSSGTVLVDAGSWGVGSASANWAAGRGVVRHTFLPRQDEFDPTTFLPPMSIMVYKDVGSAFLFDGCVIPSIEFQIEAKQLVKATANVMARSPTRIGRSNSVAALRSPGGAPWVWDMSSIQTGPGMSSLASDPNFESLTIKYSTPMEGVVLLDGTKKNAEFQANGFQNAEVSGTISFRDQLDYDKFAAWGTSAMRVTMANRRTDMVLGNPASAHYYTADIIIPALKFLTWSTPVRGPNRLTTQFTAVAELDVTSNYVIQIDLTNTTSNYLGV